MHALSLYRRHECSQGAPSHFPQIQREYTETCRQLSLEIGYIDWNELDVLTPGLFKLPRALKTTVHFQEPKVATEAEAASNSWNKCLGAGAERMTLGTQDGDPGCIPNSSLNFPSADTLSRPLQLTCLTSLIPTISTYFPYKST